MIRSMSPKGNSCDNASTESSWGSLKRARVHGKNLDTKERVKSEVKDWLSYYDTKRLHSSLNYLSPMQFEVNWMAAQLKQSAKPCPC